jgi:hypothetical protein
VITVSTATSIGSLSTYASVSSSLRDGTAVEVSAVIGGFIVISSIVWFADGHDEPALLPERYPGSQAASRCDSSCQIDALVAARSSDMNQRAGSPRVGPRR